MLSTSPLSKVPRAFLIGLVLVPFITVTANAAPQEFTFEVDRSLLIADLDLSSPGDGYASAQKSVAKAIPAASHSSTLQEVWQQTSATGTEAKTSTMRSKSFGKWLKKRWWVPTLAAVAVGVVLAEPFDGRDNPDDPN